MIKYVAASIWALASCFFLWFFTYLASLPSVDGRSPYLLNFGELFFSFVIFTLVVTLGGAAYYVMSKLLDAPYDAEQKGDWGRLIIYLKLALVLEFSVIMVLLYLRDVYIGRFAIEIFMTSFVALWLLAIYVIRIALFKMRDMRVLAKFE